MQNALDDDFFNRRYHVPSLLSRIADLEIKLSTTQKKFERSQERCKINQRETAEFEVKF